MIIALLNKGLLFALLYFLYKAYKASSGIRELLGDVPQTLAVAALLVAAGLLSLVALLRCGVALRATASARPSRVSQPRRIPLAPQEIFSPRRPDPNRLFPSRPPAAPARLSPRLRAHRRLRRVGPSAVERARLALRLRALGVPGAVRAAAALPRRGVR